MDLNQVTIASKDVEMSMRFYRTLGLKLIVDALPRYVRLECPDGNSTFSISKSEQSINTDAITIYFEDENLDMLVNRLKEEGLKFFEEPEDKNYLWREAKIKDPDGNIIILYKAGKNRKNPPWRIN